jgi:hypothetical protein
MVSFAKKHIISNLQRSNRYPPDLQKNYKRNVSKRFHKKTKKNVSLLTKLTVSKTLTLIIDTLENLQKIK